MRFDLYPTQEKKPTLSETASIPSQFDLSTGQVIGAYVEEVFEGVGSAKRVLENIELQNAKERSIPLNEEQFKNSPYYRSDIQYESDMTEESLEILSNSKKNQERRDFIINQASTAQNIIGFGASIGAGIFEPRNLAEGLAIGAVTAGAGAFISPFKNALKTMSNAKRALTVGAITGIGQGVIDAPIDIAIERNFQNDYTMFDASINIFTGVALGAVADVGVAKIGEKLAKRKQQKKNPIYYELEEISNKYNVDPATAYGIIGYESSFNPKARNKDTGAFGFAQFMEDTAKEYGVNKKSSRKDQLDAFMRFTKDNTDYLKKNLDRDVTAGETYLAHWLGRAGALSVLKANPNESFISAMKKTPYYKKNGKSYANLVLSQNKLPKNATIRDVIGTASERVNIHINYSKKQNIDIPPQVADEIDLSVSQSLNGEKVDLSPLYIANHDKINKDYKKQLDNINQSFENLQQKSQNLINENLSEIDIGSYKKQYKEEINKTEIDILFKIDQYKESIDNLKKNKVTDKFYTYNYEAFPLNGELYNNRKFFLEEEFKTLKKLKKENKKNIQDLENFDTAKEEKKIFKEKKIPIDLIESIENEISNFTKKRQFERQDFKGKNLKVFDQETEKKINRLKDNLQDLKYYRGGKDISDIKLLVRNKKKSLKAKIIKNEAKIQSAINILNNNIAEHQNKININFKDAVNGILKSNNNHIISEDDINVVNEISQKIESNKKNKISNNQEILELEKTIEAYKKSDLLDQETIDYIDRLNSFTKEDFDNIYKEAEVCLLTGGKA